MIFVRMEIFNSSFLLRSSVNYLYNIWHFSSKLWFLAVLITSNVTSCARHPPWASHGVGWTPLQPPSKVTDLSSCRFWTVHRYDIITLNFLPHLKNSIFCILQGLFCLYSTLTLFLITSVKLKSLLYIVILLIFERSINIRILNIRILKFHFECGQNIFWGFKFFPTTKSPQTNWPSLSKAESNGGGVD